MILTPIAPDRLRALLRTFAAALAEESARRALRRITRPAAAARARGHYAALHHSQAMALARSFGMGLAPRPPRAGYGWDGRALAQRMEAYVLLHEIAHFQLAAPSRRRCVDFGLGPGPDTGNRTGAERRATRFGLARETEEAMASLLGILWEAEMGHPALASFLDQNWLEGATRPAVARHFETVLRRLRAAGFITASGRPTRRLRRTPDP